MLKSNLAYAKKDPKSKASQHGEVKQRDDADTYKCNGEPKAKSHQSSGGDVSPKEQSTSPDTLSPSIQGQREELLIDYWADDLWEVVKDHCSKGITHPMLSISKFFSSSFQHAIFSSFTHPSD